MNSKQKAAASLAAKMRRLGYHAKPSDDGMVVFCAKNCGGLEYANQ